MRMVANLESNTLARCSYDDETQALDITFNNGRTYTYEGVPIHVYEGLRDDPSPGSYYHRNIKTQYGNG